MSLFSSINVAEDRAGPAYRRISEITEEIKEILELGFADAAVIGEVSGVARPRSGHVYFSLKDESALLKAVLWKSDAQRLRFDLTDGLSVRAKGRLTVYAPRGEYQLNVREIEPEGIGALELAFRRMFERLKAEGLFEEDRKRPLPRYPRRIAVVTSPTGAAIRDFLQVTGRRWPLAEIVIVPVRVQGPGAAEEIASGLATANALEAVDLLVLTRGGGSLEDLWAFNEEIVARAIVRSTIPVVSAVGHEVDVTIADFAADFRALTPSEAGERCVPDEREVRAFLKTLGDRLRRLAIDRLDETKFRLDELSQRLDRAARRSVDDRRHRLARMAATLEALSPLGVLSRGYGVTFREDAEGGSTPVRSSSEVRVGDLLRTRLHTGEILSRVESIRLSS